MSLIFGFEIPTEANQLRSQIEGVQNLQELASVPRSGALAQYCHAESETGCGAAKRITTHDKRVIMKP